MHPIPPGLWCVPSALVAITGEPFDSVIHPALNRHGGKKTLTDMVVASSVPAAIATLQELRYRVLRYTKLGRSTVAKFAALSVTRFPGKVFFVHVPEHVLAVKDGRVYDSWTPHGEPGASHPFNTAPVDAAYLVERR